MSLLEKAELLRRRNMTDEERMEEDMRLGKFKEKEKPKWNFMQKFYHKGVFFMDESSMKEDDVRRKDYASAPTLEDRIDKEKLPEVLQVKNFGKRGRTKYTHLVDQDTTYSSIKKNPNIDLAQTAKKPKVDLFPDKRLMDKYLNKRSGVGKL